MKRWIVVTLLLTLTLAAAGGFAYAGNPAQEPPSPTATPGLGFSGGKAENSASSRQNSDPAAESGESTLEDSVRRSTPMLSSGAPAPTPAPH